MKTFPASTERPPSNKIRVFAGQPVDRDAWYVHAVCHLRDPNRTFYYDWVLDMWGEMDPYATLPILGGVQHGIPGPEARMLASEGNVAEYVARQVWGHMDLEISVAHTGLEGKPLTR